MEVSTQTTTGFLPSLRETLERLTDVPTQHPLTPDEVKACMSMVAELEALPRWTISEGKRRGFYLSEAKLGDPNAAVGAHDQLAIVAVACSLKMRGWDTSKLGQLLGMVESDPQTEALKAMEREDSLREQLKVQTDAAQVLCHEHHEQVLVLEGKLGELMAANDTLAAANVELEAQCKSMEQALQDAEKLRQRQYAEYEKQYDGHKAEIEKAEQVARAQQQELNRLNALLTEERSKAEKLRAQVASATPSPEVNRLQTELALARGTIENQNKAMARLSQAVPLKADDEAVDFCIAVTSMITKYMTAEPIEVRVGLECLETSLMRLRSQPA